MGKTVISVEHLSKRYDLGVIGTGTVSRDINRWWARLRGQPDPYARIGEVDHGNRQGESILALDDVSFKVEQGEVLGIIGRNGAGKSTLLKILSQVTAPTSGEVKIKGRIGALLEVGTGFHPELTGRENVYLNGAILGMTRGEVDRKFDEIVDFSGVEKFIDTPVKRYSSGMKVRLGFAVAAHLDPEILIVDEVLAVGDAEFQKKCLGKMGDVAHEGRTVLFVSHNMGAIQNLCGKSALINQGKLIDIDESSKTINKYLNTKSNSSIDLVDYRLRRGNGEVKIIWAQIQGEDGSPKNSFSIGNSFRLLFKTRLESTYQNQRIKFSIVIRASNGTRISNIVNSDCGFEFKNPVFENTFKIIFHDLRFYPDIYYISIWVGGVIGIDTYDFVEDCVSFEINDGGKYTTRALPRSSGLLLLTPDWQEITPSK